MPPVAMPHRSRAEFSGALYHVTARAPDGAPIFDREDDRGCLLETLAASLRRFDATCFAYCVMGNHYHAVVQTWRPNLARLIADVHRRYLGRVHGHGEGAAQFPAGTFDALLIERNVYLLETCRYVDLNPVRAGLVRAPADWPWSSYRAHAGLATCPAWLNAAALHRLLGSRTPWRDGTARYADYVAGAAPGGGTMSTGVENSREDTGCGS
jgi:REP element-mobilizing transposase RayT